MSEASARSTVAASGATSPLLPGRPGGLRAHAGAGRRGGAPHRRGGRARDDRPASSASATASRRWPARCSSARRSTRTRPTRSPASSTRRRRGPRHGRGAPRPAGAGNALTGSGKRPAGTTPPRQGVVEVPTTGGDVREGYYEAERRKWDEIAQRRGDGSLQVRDRDFGAYCARVTTMAGIAGFLGDLRGAEVLELGCGMGELTTLLALSGARVDRGGHLGRERGRGRPPRASCTGCATAARSWSARPSRSPSPTGPSTWSWARRSCITSTPGSLRPSSSGSCGPAAGRRSPSRWARTRRWPGRATICPTRARTRSGTTSRSPRRR